MLSRTGSFALSIVHFQFIIHVPADTSMNRQTGDDETDQAQGERPGVGTGGIEEKPTDPRTKGTADSETDFQKAEDEADLMAGKNIAYDRAVGRIAGAVTDAIKRDGEIDQPKRRANRHGDHACDAERGDEDRDAVGFAPPQPVGDGAPKDRCADADKADQTEIKSSGEFFVAHRDEVGDGVGVDHEQGRAEGEMANHDAPERKYSRRFAERPVAWPTLFHRVGAGRCG